MGTPCGARAGIVRAPHVNHRCFSYPTGPVRGPCRTRKGAVRQPYGHVRELTRIGKTPARVSYLAVRAPCVQDPQGCRTAALRTRKGIDQNWQNSRTGVVFGRTGPLRAPQGLFTGCLQSLNPYGARKIIMHALKLYGPRTGRQNSYGAARGPCGPHEWTYNFCSKQPGNSPYGARKCDVTEA